MGKVFLLEDDSDLRRTLQLTLESFGFEVSSYENGEEFLREGASSPHEPSCLLLDVGLPGIDGLKVLSRLTAAGWRPPIVMISEQAEIPIAVQAIKNGAFDFLEKPILPDRLREVLEKALSSDHSRIRSHREHAQYQRRLSSLSQREREVLQLILEAKNSKQIANELFISVKTVLRHKGNIRKKMKARNDVELFAMFELQKGNSADAN